MLTWTVVYTARPVLAALQTSYRSRRNAAAVTPREPQSRDVRVCGSLRQKRLAVMGFRVPSGRASGNVSLVVNTTGRFFLFLSPCDVLTQTTIGRKVDEYSKHGVDFTARRCCRARWMISRSKWVIQRSQVMR